MYYSIMLERVGFNQHNGSESDLAPEAEELLGQFPVELQRLWFEKAVKEKAGVDQVRVLAAALETRHKARQVPGYSSGKLRVLEAIPESLRAAAEEVDMHTKEVKRGNNGKILVCNSDSLARRPVVYKVLLKSDELAEKRLLTEASFHAEIADLAQQHPELGVGIPAIYYFLSHKDVHAFALEFLSTAVSVEDVVLGVATLPSSCDLGKIFDAVQKFVALMNRNNFWHQDLHFGNIMIETSGDPKKPIVYLIDFGGCAYSFEDPKKRGDIDKSSDCVSVEVVQRQLAQYLQGQTQGVSHV